MANFTFNSGSGSGSGSSETFLSPELVKIRDGDSPALICIDGFLSKGEDTSQQWLAGLPYRYATQAVYVLRWDAKNLEDISALLDSSMHDTSSLWQVAFNNYSGSEDWLSTLAQPWEKARDNAQLAGMWLACQIQNRAEEKEREYVLLGHSLGARVIYYCLDALRNLSRSDDRLNNRIAEVYLLGGAVDHSVCAHSAGLYNSAWVSNEGLHNTISWHGFEHLIAGLIHNFYSNEDDVLRYLFQIAEGLNDRPSEEPIGRNPIDHLKVRNHDVSHHVSGHTQYKENLHRIMSVV